MWLSLYCSDACVGLLMLCVLHYSYKYYMLCVLHYSYSSTQNNSTPMVDECVPDAETAIKDCLTAFRRVYVELRAELAQQEGSFFGGSKPHFGEFMIWHVVDMVAI